MALVHLNQLAAGLEDTRGRFILASPNFDANRLKWTGSVILSRKKAEFVVRADTPYEVVKQLVIDLGWDMVYDEFGQSRVDNTLK